VTVPEVGFAEDDRHPSDQRRQNKGTTMNLRQKLTAFAAASVIGIFALADSASAIYTAGTRDKDVAGETVYWNGTRSCTVTAGDPVIVTVNGTRMLRSTGMVTCNSNVRIGLFRAQLGIYPTEQAVQTKTTSNVVGGSQASVVVEIPCRGVMNNSYTGYFEAQIDFTNDNYPDAHLWDFSRWNTRSCNV
jgi:hypothetical protein